MATMVDTSLDVQMWHAKYYSVFDITNKSEKIRMCRWTTWTEKLCSFYAVPAPFVIAPGEMIKIQFKHSVDFNKLKKRDISKSMYLKFSVMFQLVCDDKIVFLKKLDLKYKTMFECDLYLTSNILLKPM